jgi:hypothetical protein
MTVSSSRARSLADSKSSGMLGRVMFWELAADPREAEAIVYATDNRGATSTERHVLRTLLIASLMTPNIRRATDDSGP